MTKSILAFALRVVGLFSPHPARLEDERVRQLVGQFLARRRLFLQTARHHGTPLYAIDTDTLRTRARQFTVAFSGQCRSFQPFYAMKSNSHPLIIATLLREGLGLDVSSGRELRAALSYGAEKIVFSGPGKTDEELRLVLQHVRQVTVLIDSFAELSRLNDLAAEQHLKVRAGVRLAADDKGIWRKFGIPRGRLVEFFEAAESCPAVSLQGIQFHLSWNLSAAAQVKFIAALGTILAGMDPEQRRRIEFVDVGGGFWPEQGEWLQAAAGVQGMLRAAVDAAPIGYHERYYRPACSIREFAQNIGQALLKHLPADMSPTICAEPGRWLSHDAMHILLRVADRKADDLIITDGGTNAIGWDRFETDFFPVINLSRPGVEEHSCLVAGSLCTPHDIWGYSYFGDGINAGDFLLIPCQGAYTYSLRQEFIKPLPGCAELTPASDRDPIEASVVKDMA